MAANPLTAALAKVQKAYKDAVRDVRVSGIIERFYLESPQLNFLFGGGFPIGRIVQLHGPESGGKSTLSTYIAGEVQKKRPDHKVVIYVDFERTFETTFAEKLGLNVDAEKFIFLRPENGEEAFAIVEELVRTNEIGLIIWDSDTTTPTRSQLTDEYGKANFGGSAKLMSEALRKFNPLLEKFKTSMFMISQERDAVGEMYGPGYKVTGGRAIKFYASNRSRVQRIDYIKEKGIITGIQMRVKNEKNKAGIPYREAELTLDFEKGFDVNNEYMDFIISLGIAEQSGSWFKLPEFGVEKLHGREEVQDWFNHHPTEYAKVKLMVNERLTGETVLDEDNEPVVDEEFEEPPEIPVPEEA